MVDKFIRAIENSGDMTATGDFIIYQSLSNIARIHNNSGNKLTLLLNISVKPFLETVFIDKLSLA